MQAAALAVAVLAATAGGFAALSDAFNGDGRGVGETPGPETLPQNGEIVFSAEGDDGYTHLYAMKPDGSGRRQLTDFGTNDSDPAISPDGRTVAFVHQLEDVSPAIATIPIDGGRTVAWLTDAELFVTDGPSWSPDGTRIAFAAHDGQVQRIFVMDANGSDVRPITGDEVYWAEGPAWSPNGSTIAFSASPLSGDEQESVWDIYTVAPDGRDLVNVTNSPEPPNDEVGPTWSPDGERIAFSRAGGEGQMIVLRGSDGTETAITDGSHVDTSPAWSPDGTLIVFERAPLEGGRWNLWSMRPDGTDATQLTVDGAFGPAWQPIPGGVAPTPAVSPSLEPEGRDIGLGFNVCNLERLGGIDFLGDGRQGQAWTGAQVKENGRCPNQDAFVTYLVAADFDGDGLADAYSQTVEHCFYCLPFDAVDFDADGHEELVVLSSGGSTPSFMIYGLHGAGGDPQITPLLVAEPGNPAARHEPDRPLTFSTGGDEGYSGWVRCEDFPAAPVLVITWRDHPTEGDTMEVHETRLVLQNDGLFHVVGSNDYSAPVGDSIPGVSDEAACGVDWQV